MWTRILAFFAVALTALMPSGAALAQRSGTSAFGSSGFGSSGFGSSGFGSSGFGGSGMSGFGSSGLGGSGFGSSGFGTSGFGSSGFGNSSFGQSGFGGSGFGNSQFGGGQSFVGRDAADMQSTFMQSNSASTQFFKNMNRQMSRRNRRQQTATTTTENPPQKMRVQVHTAFDTPRPTSNVVAATLQTRLAKILADHHMTQPTVTVQDGTAVISGAAASDSERQVIAQLVALEPGVREVRNEMTVAGEPNAGTAHPSGS